MASSLQATSQPDAISQKRAAAKGPSGQYEWCGNIQAPLGSPPKSPHESNSSDTNASPTGVRWTSATSSMIMDASVVVTTFLAPRCSAKSISRWSTSIYRPMLSNAIMRSASPSWTTAQSAPVFLTIIPTYPRYSSSGSEGRKNCPAGLQARQTVFTSASARRLGVSTEPAPFPQSMTTERPGSIETASRIAFLWGARASKEHSFPWWRQSAQCGFLRNSSTSSCWACVNEDPSGLNSLIPLYSSGLWEAVIMHPAFAVRALYATEGVGAIPVKRAFPPEPSIPASMARASTGLVVRVSVPTMQSGYRSPMTAPTAREISTSDRSNCLRIPDDPKSMNHGGCFV